MKIVISGYYGFNNTGDEAVLDSVISGIRKDHPHASITVLSADPGRTSKQYGVRSIRRTSLYSIIREIKGCDLLISGGGSLFQDATSRFSVIYYLGIIWIAVFFGIKFAVFGQGYGPVKGRLNIWLISKTLNSASSITLRDERSLKDLRAIGVTVPPAAVCADPVFRLEQAGISNIISEEDLEIEKRQVIGVCLRAPVKKDATFPKRIAGALDAVSSRQGTDMLFIPFQLPEDAEFCAEVSALMKSKTDMITREHTPREILGLIGTLDLIIGMRLHSLIMAASAFVPSVAIDYDPKVSALAGELGIRTAALDLSVEQFSMVFSSCWEGREKIKAGLAEKVRTARERAQMNFRILSGLIDRIDSKIYLFGAKIDNMDMSSAVSRIDGFIKSGSPHLVLTPNPEIIMAAQKDKELMEIINSADLGIPDGIGIVAASKILRTPLPERVTGIDLMLNILELAKQKNYSVFLLGSAPGVAEQAAKNLQGVKIAGTHDGYFKDADDSRIVELVKNSKADILFVGMGAPRQEKWLAKHYKEMGAKVNMVVGGSMDVISGKVSRAPEITQKLGIEWLWRLAKEPKRIKRQLNLVRFLGKVLRQRYFPF